MQKKIIGQIIFMAIMMSHVAFADIYDLEMNVGSSTLEARFNATLPVEEGFLTTGIGAIYNEDDYKLADITLALGKDGVLPGVKFSVGLRGLWGDIDREYQDSDLMAAALAFSGKYTAPKSILPIPVGVSMDLSFAPDPLCFLDSDRYLGFRTSLDLSIIKGGALILGYRYIKIDFDDSHGKWDMSDDMFFVGYQLRY